MPPLPLPRQMMMLFLFSDLLYNIPSNRSSLPLFFSSRKQLDNPCHTSFFLSFSESWSMTQHWLKSSSLDQILQQLNSLKIWSFNGCWSSRETSSKNSSYWIRGIIIRLFINHWQCYIRRIRFIPIDNLQSLSWISRIFSKTNSKSHADLRQVSVRGGTHARLIDFWLNRYDTDKDKSLNFNELKFMMEKLGLPQTHLSLKAMIKRVDEDQDGKISFREVTQLNSSTSTHHLSPF